MKRILYFLGIFLVSLLSINITVEASGNFKDVPKGHWAYNEIKFLTQKQVIFGYSNGHFGPSDVITRKQAAIMMSRALDLPLDNRPNLTFEDFKPNESGYKEVLAVVDEGLFLKGAHFYPNEPLTREDMARCLVIAYELKGDTVLNFSDVSVDSMYLPYIEKLAANKITTGFTDGTFRPKDSVNRAQFSTFIARVHEGPVKYNIVVDGRIIEQFSLKEDAVNYAVENPGTTVHPANDHLNSYPNTFLSSEETNIKSGVLIYNGYEIEGKYGSTERFNKEFFKPYIAYKKNGNYIDKMFDTFIILGRKHPNGEFPETELNDSNYKDWKWYIDRTFGYNGAISNLRNAVSEIPIIDKVKVYVAIPYPKDEGKLIGLNGEEYDVNEYSRYNLVKWYIDEVLKEFETRKYGEIQFEGFYWLNETVISKNDEFMVTLAANYVKKNGKRFIYSPHARSTNLVKWEPYGFDGTFLQMNAFKAIHDANKTKRILHSGFVNALTNGTAVNIEIEDSTANIDLVFQNLRNYMEVGRLYNVPSYSMIMYQGTEMIHRLATFPRDDYRKIYDELYAFLNNK